MTAKEAEILREYAEKLARDKFPDADKIVANPHVEDGPVVEVWKGKRASTYRLTGYEI